MKETVFKQAAEYVINLNKRAIEQFVKTEIAPLGDFGNPEKLLNKPYELWSPQDKMLLSQIYGPEPNTLSKLIFRKEYLKTLKAEAEVVLR